VNITHQALIQYAGMAIAFALGGLAHWHGRNHEMLNCPHHGWDLERGEAYSWLHPMEIRRSPRMQCSYCGKIFPARLVGAEPSTGSEQQIEG